MSSSDLGPTVLEVIVRQAIVTLHLLSFCMNFNYLHMLEAEPKRTTRRSRCYHLFLLSPSLPLRPPCLLSLTVSRSLLALCALLQYCGKGERQTERVRERERDCQKHYTISKRSSSEPTEL